MALDLAIFVATGRSFLGRRTLKGKVPYLDLESGESRVKKRLSLLPGRMAREPVDLTSGRHAGVEIISKLLGHSSTQITYDLYVHLFEDDLDDTLRQAVGA